LRIGADRLLSRQLVAFIAVMTALALTAVAAWVASPLVCPVGEGCPPASFVSGLPPPLAVGLLWVLVVALNAVVLVLRHGPYS
jgi:hypothetical protein